jgi:hypothetical protein
MLPTKAEDDEMMTTSMSDEAHESHALPDEQENEESLADSKAERSASPSSPVDGAGAEDAGTTGDMSTPIVQTRCVMNFLQPQPGMCDSKIFNDDRHYISNFFGRNKSCSTSIPDDFYMVLCRKCMQAMKYRLKSGKGPSEVQVQVAAIKHVLRNMAASGKWVVLEVQLTKAEHDRRKDPKKYEDGIKTFNEAIVKAREEAKQKGQAIKRRNTKKPIIPVPDWLAEEVVKNDNLKDKEGKENKGSAQDYTAVHDRNPTRWTFEHLIELVDMIGVNCDILPNIECLPVTQGEIDEVQVKDARRYRAWLLAEEQQDIKDVANAQENLNEDPDNKNHQKDLKTLQENLAIRRSQLLDVEDTLKRAEKQAAKTKHMIPPKRVQANKTGKKEEISKTAAKKSQKGTTKDRDSQDTMTDPEIQDESKVGTSDEEETRSVDSLSPPPGWKGKGKATAVTTPIIFSKKRKDPPKSRRKTSATKPTTPPPQVEEELAAAAPTGPSTPPPAAIRLPTTPNQPTYSSPVISTTRSTGRRLQLAAMREPAQAQTETRSSSEKRKAEDEEEGMENAGVAVTGQSSPVKKKIRFTKTGSGSGKKDEAGAGA